VTDATQRVLVVDDDPATLLLMQNALEAAGFVVATAQGGRAALEELCRATLNDERYAAILLDVAMPEIDGWRVLNAVKANPLWADMKAVVMSGYRQPAEAFTWVTSCDGVFVEKGADFDRMLVNVLGRLTTGPDAI